MLLLKPGDARSARIALSRRRVRQPGPTKNELAALTSHSRDFRGTRIGATLTAPLNRAKTAERDSAASAASSATVHERTRAGAQRGSQTFVGQATSCPA